MVFEAFCGSAWSSCCLPHRDVLRQSFSLAGLAGLFITCCSLPHCSALSEGLYRQPRTLRFQQRQGALGAKWTQSHCSILECHQHVMAVYPKDIFRQATPENPHPLKDRTVVTTYKRKVLLAMVQCRQGAPRCPELLMVSWKNTGWFSAGYSFYKVTFSDFGV